MLLEPIVHEKKWQKRIRRNPIRKEEEYIRISQDYEADDKYFHHQFPLEVCHWQSIRWMKHTIAGIIVGSRLLVFPLKARNTNNYGPHCSFFHVWKCKISLFNNNNVNKFLFFKNRGNMRMKKLESVLSVFWGKISKLWALSL